MTFFPNNIWFESSRSSRKWRLDVEHLVQCHAAIRPDRMTALPVLFHWVPSPIVTGFYILKYTC